MFCPHCGAPNQDDAVFCGNCGEALSPDAAASAVEEALEAEREEGLEFPALDEPPTGAAPPPLPMPPPAPVVIPTSGMAIASLVLGISGLTVLPLLGSILALIFGYTARKEIREHPDRVSGDGLAVAGIVLGWISVAIAVLGILAFGAMVLCSLCASWARVY